MFYNISTIEQFIELKRQYLFEISKQYNLTHPNVIRASQDLDKLLNLYQPKYK
jgi:hypothetical protein